MAGYLVCPEFLPALTGLLAREGLLLSTLAAAAAAGTDDEDRQVALWAVLRAAAVKNPACPADIAERYAAEALVRAGQVDERPNEEIKGTTAISDEPPVAAALDSLRPETLRRLVVPGAVLLGVCRSRLRTGPAGTSVLDIVTSCDKHGYGKEDGPSVDVVIRQVAYGSGEPSTGAAAVGAASPLPLSLLVDVIQLPAIEGGPEAAVAWAELVCRAHAGAVFVHPAHHSMVADLLAELGAAPVDLSSRSGAARGRLSARLVALARQLRYCSGAGDAETGSSGWSTDCIPPAAVEDVRIATVSWREARANLCLASASASSPVLAATTTALSKAEHYGAGATPQPDLNAPMLLIQGRDLVPPGALAAGAIATFASRGHVHGPGFRGTAITLDFGAGLMTGRLTRSRVPHCRAPAVLPQEGAPLACLLLDNLRDDFSHAKEPVPSLIGSTHPVLENLLANQVGLCTLTVPVPDGCPDRARACRALAEACGSSLRVEVSPDGLDARVVGRPSEAEAATHLVASLRGTRIEVTERLAWRIIGKGGSSVRQLEQDSGGAWIHIHTQNKPFIVDIFGVASAVVRAEALLHERHARVSFEVPCSAVPWIIGQGGAKVREIEAASGGASVHVNALGGAHIVEVIGEVSAVERAVAALREISAPALRIEIPRRVMPYIVGQGGASRRSIEAESGASLSVIAEASQCVIEVAGDRAATAKARSLINHLLEKHSYASFELIGDSVAYVLGRRARALREIEVATGAILRADTRREPSLVEVFGTRPAVEAALEALRHRASPSTRRVEVPRHALASIIGRGGSGVQEIEHASGAWLRVDLLTSDAVTCVIEVVGEEAQVEDAEALLRVRAQPDRLEVPSAVLQGVIGQGGIGINAMQISTGAVLHVLTPPDDINPAATAGSPRIVEVFGHPQARVAARARFEEAIATATVARASILDNTLTVAGPEAVPARKQSGAPPSATTIAFAERGVAVAFAPNATTMTPRRNAAEVPIPLQSRQLSPRATSRTPRRRARAVVERSGSPLNEQENQPPRCSAESETGDVNSQSRMTQGKSLLEGKELPDRLMLRTVRTLPRAWTLPLNLDSPTPSLPSCLDSKVGRMDLLPAGSLSTAPQLVHEGIEDAGRRNDSPGLNDPSRIHMGMLLPEPTMPMMPADKLARTCGKLEESPPDECAPYDNSQTFTTPCRPLLHMSCDGAPAGSPHPLVVATIDSCNAAAAAMTPSSPVHPATALGPCGLGGCGPSVASTRNEEPFGAMPASEPRSLWRPKSAPQCLVKPFPCSWTLATQGKEQAGRMLSVVAEESLAEHRDWQGDCGLSEDKGNNDLGTVASVPWSESECGKAQEVDNGDGDLDGIDCPFDAFRLSLVRGRSRSPVPALIPSSTLPMVSATVVASPTPGQKRNLARLARGFVSRSIGAWIRRPLRTPRASLPTGTKRRRTSLRRTSEPNVPGSGSTGAGVATSNSQTSECHAQQAHKQVDGFPVASLHTAASPRSDSMSQLCGAMVPSSPQLLRASGRGKPPGPPPPPKWPLRPAPTAAAPTLPSSTTAPATAPALSASASQLLPLVPQTLSSSVPPTSDVGSIAEAASMAAMRRASLGPTAVAPPIAASTSMGATLTTPTVIPKASSLFAATMTGTTAWARMPKGARNLCSEGANHSIAVVADATSVATKDAISSQARPHLRSLRPRSPQTAGPHTTAAAVGLAGQRETLYILDGLNILKNHNNPTWCHSASTGEPELAWDQLESACRYYTSHGQRVSVYLPPLRPGHELRLHKCRQEFGDVFVCCRSTSDDKFMINTAKLYESTPVGDGEPTTSRACRIVTNDRFVDWQRLGDVDAHWVERHCVRFAIGPGGFVPSELV